jgi:hypothetical protein
VLVTLEIHKADETAMAAAAMANGDPTMRIAPAALAQRHQH